VVDQESVATRPEFGQSLGVTHPTAIDVFDSDLLVLPVEVDGQISLQLPEDPLQHPKNTTPFYFEKPTGFPRNRIVANTVRKRRSGTFI
jgi:hypothetical protein